MSSEFPPANQVFAPVVSITGQDYDLNLMNGAEAIPFAPVFNPVSPQAKVIVDLFVVVLIICGIILLIVTSLVTYSLLRFRGKAGAPEPDQTTGHTKLEIVWTVIPLLIVTWLFVLTARAMNRTDPLPEKKERKPDLIIIGHQWWWEARYPNSGVVAANEIHIPTGRRLLLLLDSADVIHDFWVPQLARKQDMIPGHPNEMWLEADHPGTYTGPCAEYCGMQHAWMRVAVIAQSPAEFAAWEQQQLQPLPRPTTPTAQRGEKVFMQMTCANCHAIKGTSARAQAGPDLTHLADRRTLAAGLMDNNVPNLARWLSNPQAFKEGSLMPNLHLTAGQVADLVSYLEGEKPGTSAGIGGLR